MDWPAWKAFELYVSAPELLAASIVAGIAICAFTWWLRNHIIKERLELLRSQRDDLNAKLAEGNAKLLELEKQIAAEANRTALTADVISTAKLLYANHHQQDGRYIIPSFSARFPLELTNPPRIVSDFIVRGAAGCRAKATWR
jgi:hypothetical protein